MGEGTPVPYRVALLSFVIVPYVNVCGTGGGKGY